MRERVKYSFFNRMALSNGSLNILSTIRIEDSRVERELRAKDFGS
jgi:hypothetical protein